MLADAIVLFLSTGEEISLTWAGLVLLIILALVAGRD